MGKKVLFVVEGGKDENNLIIKTFKHVMKLSNEDVEIVEYNTVIYDLYDNLSSEEYDSLIDYLWVNHRKIFTGEFIKPADCFSSIYLIFDFDPQDHRFSLEKCKWLISYFSDETRQGKLYFNYPMVESLLDIINLSQKNFNNRTVPRRNLKGETYKTRVKTHSIIKKYPSKYSLKDNSFLKILIFLHYNKYLFLTGSTGDDVMDSEKLLKKEIDYYEDGKISILNSSILILTDYNLDVVNNLSE